MRQIGIVMAVCSEYATVEVSRKSACEGCHVNKDGNCSACVTFGDRSTTTKADNSIGAEVGDRVVLETESNTVLLYAAAVFLFPLVLAVIGYFIGTLIPHAASPYIGAAVGFACAFIIVWATLNRRAEKRLDVRITGIL